MTSKNNFRTGRLDKQEMQYIEDHFKTQSVEAIASVLNRRITTVRTYTTKLPGKTANQYLAVLMERPAWQDLKDQFTDDELEQFASEYHGFIEQFQGEVLHSEEGQILDAIRIGILASRKLKEEKTLIDSVRSMEKDLAREKKVTPKDRSAINDLQHDIIMARQLMDNLSKQAGEFIKQKHVALEKMKATRRDRTDINTAAFKTSFKDWMKRLVDDPIMREEFGKHMEKFRLAAEAEYNRLRQPHTYVDNNQDLPILNVETLGQLKDEAMQNPGENE
tara:strand:+ start:4198 stop:5028 length:831 start_codon:yes stop_codon:yes gene_type:complete